jgi:hypothetical protein
VGRKAARLEGGYVTVAAAAAAVVNCASVEDVLRGADGKLESGSAGGAEGTVLGFPAAGIGDGRVAVVIDVDGGNAVTLADARVVTEAFARSLKCFASNGCRRSRFTKAASKDCGTKQRGGGVDG